MNTAGYRSHARSMRGITLIELMIVVAIVAILAAIAYPSYREQVRRSNRSEGQAMLQNAAALQERFFSNNNTYTTNMTQLGFTANPAISEHGYYSVAAAACGGGTIATCYLLTATAQGGQADDTKCATMTLNNLGQKTSAPNANCWR